MAARGKKTRVEVSFAVPAGAQLVGNPRLQLLNPQGRPCELAPILLTKPAPKGRGFRELRTDVQPEGTYTVTAELRYRIGNGEIVTVTSTPATVRLPGG